MTIAWKTHTTYILVNWLSYPILPAGLRAELSDPTYKFRQVNQNIRYSNIPTHTDRRSRETLK